MIHRSSFSGSVAPRITTPVAPLQQCRHPAPLERDVYSKSAMSPAKFEAEVQAGPKNPVRFGFWQGVGTIAQLDVEADYFSGFIPNANLTTLFPNVSNNAKAIVIDRPETLKRFWPLLHLQGQAQPQMDWKNEVLILVAQERNDRKPAIPSVMYFNRFNNSLNIRLDALRPNGRSPGLAWYLGRFPNGKGAGGSSMNGSVQMSARTTAYLWAYDTD